MRSDSPVPQRILLGILGAAGVANIQMAVDFADRPLSQRLVAYGRLPLQIPLVWLAVTVARRASAQGVLNSRES